MVGWPGKCSSTNRLLTSKGKEISYHPNRVIVNLLCCAVEGPVLPLQGNEQPSATKITARVLKWASGMVTAPRSVMHSMPQLEFLNFYPCGLPPIVNRRTSFCISWNQTSSVVVLAKVKMRTMGR